MWARIIVLRLSFEFEVENWRLTRPDHHFLKKNLEGPLKSRQIWKAIWMQTMNDSDWLKGIYTVVEWLY